MNCTDRFFAPPWIRHYRQASRDFFGHTSVDAEDACADAQLILYRRLRDRDCATLSEAYVRTAFKNALRDVYRRHFGRPRPPAWVQRLGPIWERLFELFCLQRLPVEAITETLLHSASSTEVAGTPSPRTPLPLWVETAVQRLREAQACPEDEVQTVSIDHGGEDEERSIDLPGAQHAETALGEAEIGGLIFTLLGWGGGRPTATADKLTRRVMERWHELSERLEINDDERLMLRLVYQEDLPVTEVARLLGHEAHHVRRSIKRVLARIREVLVANGIRFEDFFG
jgi:RNA polymerase sigma factor (sigma-70 family)